MPPKSFNLQELRLADAIDVGRPLMEPSLNGDLHELFLGWDDIDTETFELLYPSAVLATNLIHVGMPYISFFLPSENKAFWPKDGQCPNVIPTAPITPGGIREAHDEVLKVAKDLKWRLDYTMFAKAGYLGETRLADTGDVPWSPLDFETIQRSDKNARAIGKERRPLIIAIMGEYITVLKRSDPDSEPFLRATFMAGVTMAHEIGHAIFHNDFRSFSPEGEPYVGRDCEAELGASFIYWIFGGAHPRISPGDATFKGPLFWDKQQILDMWARPHYKTSYSMPISYLEKVLSQAFWHDLGPPSDPAFSEKAIAKLTPDTTPGTDRVATATVPNWIYSHQTGKPMWKNDYNFRLQGYTAKDEVDDLPEQEIEDEKERTKDTSPHNHDASIAVQTKKNWDSLLTDTEGQQDENSSGSSLSPGQEPQGSSLDHDSDGTLVRDLGPISKSVSAPLTRITVSHSAVDLRQLGKYYEVADIDRPVGRPSSFTDVFKQLPFDPLSNCHLTRREFQQACQNLNISSFIDCPGHDTSNWLEGDIDPHKNDDMGALQRWFNHHLQFEIKRLESESVLANDHTLAKLRAIRLGTVRDWYDEDLEEYCRERSIITNCDRRGLVIRVLDSMKKETCEKTGAPMPLTGPGELIPRGSSVAILPDAWEEDRLRTICHDHGLPGWGDRAVLLARVRNFQIDDCMRELRLPPIRHSECLSTSVGGRFERYVFQADLQHSSVAALKNALYLVGDFRADAILHILPQSEDDLKKALKDDQPLSVYGLDSVRVQVERGAYGSRHEQEKSLPGPPSSIKQEATSPPGVSASTKGKGGGWGGSTWQQPTVVSEPSSPEAPANPPEEQPASFQEPQPAKPPKPQPAKPSKPQSAKPSKPQSAKPPKPQPAKPSKPQSAKPPQPQPAKPPQPQPTKPPAKQPEFRRPAAYEVAQNIANRVRELDRLIFSRGFPSNQLPNSGLDLIDQLDDEDWRERAAKSLKRSPGSSAGSAARYEAFPRPFNMSEIHDSIEDW